jgi:tRNA threonylcarbamoyladenosine biosynthesis protein TsaB
MAIILNIDTSQESASICIAREEDSIGIKFNDQQSDHASWIHRAIQELLTETGLSLSQLDAIAVTIGPGSYTGLRVGLASAKGLCYALDKPLICIPTLEMMAYAARFTEATLICPMIDARRMEVYAAIYDKNMNVVVAPEALILEPTTYESYITAHPVCFCGSGSIKLQTILQTQHARYEDIPFSAAYMAPLSNRRFHLQDFASLAYAEPLYIKEFYTAGRRK